MDAGESPGSQDDKGVIDADAKHEEGGGQVDTDEVHPDVHAEAEGGEGGENGGHHTQQAYCENLFSELGTRQLFSFATTTTRQRNRAPGTRKIGQIFRSRCLDGEAKEIQ